MSNIKILISCHKPTRTLKNNLLFPIQVGCANTDKRLDGMLSDDIGENISAKNPMYCELTAQYWAWKNLDADYYGFFHYRRYLNFSSKRYPLDCWKNVVEPSLTKNTASKYGINEKQMRKVIEGNDLIISEEKDLSKMPGRPHSVYEQYKYGNSLHIKDLLLVRKIIQRKYPEYMADLDNYLIGKKTCLCNMYIMKKELFCEYSEWLFDILKEFEKYADMSEYSVEGLRTPGHLAERLLSLFYLHLKRTRKLKIKPLQTVVFVNTEPVPTIKPNEYLPAFSKNNIAIALAANDYFVPYTATLLQSLLENSSDIYSYDILILNQNITEQNKLLLKNIFEQHTNFSLRFVDPSGLIYNYNFYTHGHFSMETYYRLVLPELFPAYEKMLYLDSDMIIQADVAELYREDVGGYLLAASHDADTAGLYNGYEEGKKYYTDHILKLKEPYQYFQAGVLLINLDEFRKHFTTEEILKFTVSQKWELLDQDVLNKLCEGRVKYIDMAWNVMVDYGGIRQKEIISLAPKWLNDMYLNARKEPKIIHYAGPEKPWFEPEMDQGNIFWQYARKTSFAEIIVARMVEKKAAETSRLRSNNRSLVHGGIQCIKDHGLIYTIGYLPKRLLG